MKNKTYGAILTFCLLSVSVSFAIPPYFWYATYGIENYLGNGTPMGADKYGNPVSPNLNYCHQQCDGFHTAVTGHGGAINNEWRRYDLSSPDDDDAVTKYLWTGTSAQCNYVDFLFWSGHGGAWGPYLGDNPDYSPLWSYDHIRFHGNGYLKWVMADACQWFCPANYASGYDPYDRWDPAFVGVHSVLGHRAVTYDRNVGVAAADGFFDNWIDNGWSIYYSWTKSQIDFMYQNGATHGLEPAIMAANYNYAIETWSAANDNAAPNGAGFLTWSTVGVPEYY